MLHQYQTKKEEHLERVGMFVIHTMWCLFFISPCLLYQVKKEVRHTIFVVSHTLLGVCNFVIKVWNIIVTSTLWNTAGSVLDFHGPFANSFMHSLVGTSIQTCILKLKRYPIMCSGLGDKCLCISVLAY